ncbi:MAG: NfeD family protein [Paludibacteraceae bacterium]|nr:NfeD family protein [Paludibacteraceae bacterium]
METVGFDFESIFSMPVWWTILAVVCLILELMTPGFVIACFSLGALLAALVALFDASLVIQLVFFAIGSVVAFLLIRPALKKYYVGREEVKTNADALIGKETKVFEDIEADDYGSVKIDGDVWKAKSNCGRISKGEKVVVVERDSIILTVTRA